MKYIFLLLSLTVFCSYCKSTKPLNSSASISSGIKKVSANFGADLTGNWALKSLWGLDDSKINKGSIKIDFENRIFSGNAGCNDVSGTFSIKGNLLIFDKNIAITKNNCPANMDKKFIGILMRVNKFDTHDGILEFSQDNIVLISYKKVN